MPVTVDISDMIANHQFGPAAGDSRPLFIGIAGGSGSGKTTIARSVVEHLDALRDNKAIERPIYDFETHTRTAETYRLEPQPIVIVEGILLFADAQLRERFDVRVFIDTEPDVRLMRRIRRDIVERGRSVESVLEQYEATVRPMHHQFVEPSKRYADIIIPEGANTGAIGTVSAMIRHFLAQ